MLIENSSLVILSPENLSIVLILTAGFTLATLLGYCAQKVNISPILGYLLAGYMIGPFFPGFTADIKIAEQLAEIGVILMMFGVGLHFKWQDLVKVRKIAVVGAIGQTSVACIVCAFLLRALGWSWESGFIIGLSIGVASTVVLVRILSEQALLQSIEGHIAVGWLIAEDVLTVIALVLLPTLASLLHQENFSSFLLAKDVLIVLLKFFLLTLFMFTLGRKIVSKVLFLITKTHSAELFTLAILALTFLIATGSALLFGTSIALGAFIAGMVIGQTAVKHQASIHASPMKDAFLVIFFLSVGMLFNPAVMVNHFSLFISVLFVILLIKPLSAGLITLFFHYPFKVACIIAVSLAQIGEFSFILAAEALKLNIIPDEGYDVIVACALISISINPLLFKWIMKWGHGKKHKNPYFPLRKNPLFHTDQQKIAVILGYGPITQSILEMILRNEIHPIIIDQDVDSVTHLVEKEYEAFYGDTSNPHILKIAKIKDAKYLIVSVLPVEETIASIKSARKIQPNLFVFVYVDTCQEKEKLKSLNVNFIFCAEEQASQVFSQEIFKYWKLNHYWKSLK